MVARVVDGRECGGWSQALCKVAIDNYYTIACLMHDLACAIECSKSSRVGQIRGPPS